jgi:hypothetical protein
LQHMGLAPNQSTRVERREDVHICKEKMEKVTLIFRDQQEHRQDRPGRGVW